MTTTRVNFFGSLAGRGLLLTICAGLAACASEAPPQVAAAAPAGATAPQALNEATAAVFANVESHADAPPHGGEVIELGGHVAHAEVVVVPDTGELFVHVLDADGQPGKRVPQPTILADVETSGRTLQVELQAAPLDGEKAGDASRFVARSDELLRSGEAKVTLRWLLVDGQVFSDTVVHWTATGV